MCRSLRRGIRLGDRPIPFPKRPRPDICLLQARSAALLSLAEPVEHLAKRTPYRHRPASGQLHDGVAPADASIRKRQDGAAPNRVPQAVLIGENDETADPLA